MARMTEDEAAALIDTIVTKFLADTRQQTEELTTTLDARPEARVYLDAVGARSVADLTAEQRREMTDILFRAMHICVHPNAN